MTKTNQDGIVYKNKAVTIQFAITNAAGAALDLTGATMRWAVSELEGGAPLLTKATGGSGITITDAAGGLCEVAISINELTQTGILYHELEVTPSGQGAQIMATGRLFCRASALS